MLCTSEYSDMVRKYRSADFQVESEFALSHKM